MIPQNPENEPRVGFPYSERSSLGAAEHVRVLTSDPEYPLNESEKQIIVDFANQLLVGGEIEVCKRVEVDGAAVILADRVSCQATNSIETLVDMTALSNEQDFDLDYFGMPEATPYLARLGLPPKATREEIRSALYDIPRVKAAFEPKDRKKLAADSRKWRIALISERLMQDPQNDEEYSEEGTKLSVNYEPQKMLNKLGDLKAYRAYLSKVIAGMKYEEPSPLSDAKKLTAEIVLGRVNEMAANLYAPAVSLARQLDASHSMPEYDNILRQFKEVVPFLSGVFKDEWTNNQERRSKFIDHWQTRGLRRVDYISNGVGINSEGKYSPIDNSVASWVDNYLPPAAPSSEVTQFTPEEVEAMMLTIWGHEEIVSLEEAILDEMDLLSEHSTEWDELDDRDGPAPDDKWQAVSTPKRTSVAINGPKKGYMVPEDRSRPVARENEPGALALDGHETVHVLQTEYQVKAAEVYPVAKIKGRRSRMMREYGGDLQEWRIDEALGISRQANMHYFRALQAKEAGLNPLQVARAFYNSLVDKRNGAKISAPEDQALRDLAADRSRRFRRAGGHDSQPLDYVEQAVVAQELDTYDLETRKKLAVAGGVFSLADAAALHRFGLFSLPEKIEPNRDPTTVAIKVFRLNFLPAIMAAAAERRSSQTE